MGTPAYCSGRMAARTRRRGVMICSRCFLPVADDDQRDPDNEDKRVDGPFCRCRPVGTWTVDSG